MSFHYEADTLDDLLIKIFKDLINEQEIFKSSRGEFTEVFGSMITLNNPLARLSRSESKGKVFSALGELFWYLSRTNNLEFIKHYISGIGTESDDNLTIRSGYGERLFGLRGNDQINNVITLLKERNSSRRAVIQIFDSDDIAKKFKSIPCTNTLQFIVRSEKLNLLVNMRSNDAYLGLPHDIFTFTMLQEIVARSLGVELGIYKHCVGSLHLYKKHIGKAEKFLNEGWQNKIAMPPMPLGDPWPSIREVSRIEELARMDQEIDLSKIEIDSYWRDICIFFLFFQAKKAFDKKLNKSYKLHFKKLEESAKKLKSKLSNSIYDMFIDMKLDSLEPPKET